MQLIAKWCVQAEVKGDVECASEEDIELHKDQPFEFLWYLTQSKYFPNNYDKTPDEKMVKKFIDFERIILTKFSGQFWFDLKQSEISSD